MHTTLLKHKDEIIDMVNDKIEYIHKHVHHDGGVPILDEEELDELLKCVKILKKLGKIRYLDHEIKMDFMEKGHNPYSGNPGHVTGTADMKTMDAAPHGHAYGTINLTTMPS